MSEKARLIAKTAIVDRNPCNPRIMPCDDYVPSFRQSEYFSQKVFPREVGDIKEYMNDTFTTNINGFSENLGNLRGSDYNKSGVYYDGRSLLNQGKSFVNNGLNTNLMELNESESISPEKKKMNSKSTNLKRQKIESERESEIESERDSEIERESERDNNKNQNETKKNNKKENEKKNK